MSRKRTITFDEADETLIAQIQQKYRPFATAHMIVRLAVRQGLRLLREGLHELPRTTEAPGASSTEDAR
jgi:hypothetical protein